MNSKGQTLLELIIVTSVSVIIVGGLVFATISSLRNATFAKNQSQATKLAQEGLERVRSVRDRNGTVNFSYGSSTFTTFNELWTAKMSLSCTPCYFTLGKDGTGGATLNQGATASFETLQNGLFRQVTITDGDSFGNEKTITAIVIWNDFSGSHQSVLTTILRKI